MSGSIKKYIEADRNRRGKETQEEKVRRVESKPAVARIANMLRAGSQVQEVRRVV